MASSQKNKPVTGSARDQQSSKPVTDTAGHKKDNARVTSNAINAHNNILVTGGAGYVGSHFCKAARDFGLNPIVYDNLSTGHRRFVGGTFYRGDLLDTEALRQVIHRYSIQTVVHFAGKAIVSESIERPDVYELNNVQGTASLLEAIRGSGVKKLIFSSSCTVYGVATRMNLDEQHPLLPFHPYGASKLAAENLILRFQEKHPIHVGLLRYFNVIGQDPFGELWEDHNPETHIVPNIIAALKNKKQFTLYGAQFLTPDGTAIRDYIDVNDLANVHLQALSVLNTKQSLISNVSQGIGYSNAELITTIERLTNKKIHVVTAPARPGDAPRLVADNTYFKSWYPHPLTSLEETLKHLLYNQFKNRRLNIDKMVTLPASVG